MTARGAAALAALAALVAVSFGVPTGVRAARPDDPCKLVDRADASRALRLPVVKLKLATMGPARTCTLRTAKLFRSLVVTAYRWGSAPEAHARFAEIIAQASARMAPTVALRGVGDEAASIASSVYVRKGSGAYVFDLIDGTVGAARTARTVALAKKALARVP